MVRKAAGEYSKTKEEQLGQAVKAAFDWFSTCYGAITKKKISNKLKILLCFGVILFTALGFSTTTASAHHADT